MKEQYTHNDFARATLATIIEQHDMDTQTSCQLIDSIMQGSVDPLITSAICVAMRMKGESEQEILGAAYTMRKLASTVPLPLDDQPVIDIVGTGGDSANLFNVSTAASFVTAACGGKVAKHCGRGVSSSSGGADLLSALGVRSNVSILQQQEIFLQHSLIFMFAPHYHPAMRFVAPIRQALKQRTFFNILGPLANPAGIKRYVLGVYDANLMPMIANILYKLGAERALVIHSNDGLDEISIAQPTHIYELYTDGTIHNYVLNPIAIGMHGDLNDCRVENTQQSQNIIRDAFAGKHTNAAKQIAINAGAALYILDKTPTIQEGAAIAMQAMHNNLATTYMHNYVQATQKYTP